MADSTLYMGSVEYRSLREGDVERCISLWCERMAPGYEDEKLLRNISLAVPGTYGFVIEVDGDVAGFSGAHCGVFSNVGSLPYDRFDDIEINPTELVSYIDIFCVDSVYEGRGFGKMLVNGLIRELSQFDRDVVTETWNREGVDGRSVVESCGLDHVYTDERYWSVSSGGNDDCPECNESPCVCSGSLYIYNSHRQSP